MKIGLTGGIGCGKSTVVGFFAEAGWSTLQTDMIVRDLLDRDVAVQSAIRERWQETVFRPDGTVDRKAIASRVFANAGELNWLESLLHPKVRTVWETAFNESPESCWLVEIPLLFEKKLETKFDSIICVESNPQTVEKRISIKGYSTTETRQRRQRQLSLEEKIRRSDYVISNSGSLNFLKLQTQRLIQQIKQFA